MQFVVFKLENICQTKRIQLARLPSGMQNMFPYFHFRRHFEVNGPNRLKHFLTSKTAAKTTGPLTGLWWVCFVDKIINVASRGTQKFHLYLVETNVSCFHSLFSHDVTKIQTQETIASSEFLLPCGITAP